MLFKSLQTYLNKKAGRVTSFTFIYWVSDTNSFDDFDKLYIFLSQLGVPSCVSPLHDKDINETDVESGETEFKKPHFHVVIDFGSGQNKTIAQCFEIIAPIRDSISIAPFDRLDPHEQYDFKEGIEKVDNLIKVWKTENCVRNMRTLLRYFKHLDNPEKHQYIEAGDEFRTFGGFELEERIYSQSDQFVLLDSLLDFIDNNEVYSYCDLVRYCKKNNKEWFTVLCSQRFSYLVINYIKSYTYENTGALNKKIEKYEND